MSLWIALATLTTLLVWGYWNSLVVLTVAWQPPPYQCVWLILGFAAVVLWARRRPMAPAGGLARWIGVLLLAASLGARLLASRYGWPLAELATMVPALASLWLVVFGWQGLAIGGPAAALLLLMLPLGNATEAAILDRAQGLVTRSSIFALQTLGVDAYREGNVIYLGAAQSGMVGPSSRLRLAEVLVAIAAATALAVRRPLWERLLILLSGPPIALTVNVLCLTSAGLLRHWGWPGVSDRLLHQTGSIIMLGLAALLVLLEYLVLAHLYREVAVAEVPQGGSS